MNLLVKLMGNISIVLVHPKYPENIGAAARVALNMGITSLVVVCGDVRPNQERMLACATHNARDIIFAIKYFSDLSEALKDFAMVVGTTARHGRRRHPIARPDQLAKNLAPIIKDNKVAILFGPENRGLDNRELQACTLLTTIPTADFSSLNLAQAVAIICYEIYRGLAEDAGLKETVNFAPRLATVQEQESMYSDIVKAIDKVDQLAGKNRPASRLFKLRSFLGRIGLQAKETRVVSEICRQLNMVLENNK